jgi:hypothetical protein
LAPPRLVGLEVLEDPGNKGSLDRRLPIEYAPKCVRQSLEVHGLEEIAVRAGSERCEQIGFDLRDGQHHDLRVREPRLYLPSSSHSAPGHPDIQETNSWSLSNRRLHGLGSICCLGTDFEATALLESTPDVLARRRVVIRNENAARWGIRLGHTATFT